MKPTNCTTLISGPGVVSRHPETDQHLARLKPVIIFDGLLCDISEYRVGTTERDHRHLAEEQSDVAEHVVPAEHVNQSGDGPSHNTRQMAVTLIARVNDGRTSSGICSEKA